MKPGVLLVGLDGADSALLSPLMDQGALPRLMALVESGCTGKLAVRPPYVRAMAWTTLATGVHAPRHGVCGDVEVREDGAGVRPTGHASWVAPAIWQQLATAGVRCAVVGWPATAPAASWDDVLIVDERFSQPVGLQADAWPLPLDCVAPAALRAELRAMRVHPADLTGLQLAAFVPQLARIDQDTDDRLARLAVALARAATVHAAATHVAREADWSLCCVAYPFLGEIAREFMRYRQGAAADVTAHDAALYGSVVDAACRFTDAMLGTLLDCVDRDTSVIVVSPHGIAREGFFAASGPGVRRDELVHGASLVDVAATVMNLFHLRGAGLDGRPIEAISPPLPTERLAPVALATNPPSYEPPAVDDDLPLAQRQAVARASLTWIANAAEACLAAGRFDEAAARYAQIVARAPNDWLARARLARCHLHLAQYAECTALAVALVEERPGDPWGHLLCAAAQVLAGDAARAQPHLAMASELGGERPAIAIRVGMLHLVSGEWQEAEACFRQSLADHAGSTEALDGLGCALHAQGRDGEAVQAFRAALGLDYHFALAHAHLAMSLAALGRWDEVAAAAAIALEQDPALPGTAKLLEQARVRGACALPVFSAADPSTPT